MNDFDISRLRTLSKLIEDKKATQSNKDEYINILYRNGRISQKHYTEYINKTSFGEDIFKAAITIGTFFLFTLVISELLKKK